MLAAAVALWAALAVPAVLPLPKHRQTVLGLADHTFLRPVAALAAATAALSVGVGFLPLSGHAAGLPPLATGAAVSALAACAALVGLAVGPVLTACGLAAAVLPGVAQLLLAAAPVGTGTGLITPLGFAALAASTPPERTGQTMGAAELGRELGDAGGPLLVATVASTATATLTWGYAGPPGRAPGRAGGRAARTPLTRVNAQGHRQTGPGPASSVISRNC